MATKDKATKGSAPKTAKTSSSADVSESGKKSVAKAKKTNDIPQESKPVQISKSAKPATKLKSQPTAVVPEPKKKSSAQPVETPVHEPSAQENDVPEKPHSAASESAQGQKWHEIRSILEKLKEDTLREIRKSVKNGTEAVAAIEPGGDIYDQASSERDRELGLLLGDREREKIHSIDEALLRIDEGEYGICEECDEDIPLGRLKAMPFTRHCVKCKSDLEKLQAQTKRVEEERAYREIPLGAEDEES